MGLFESFLTLITDYIPTAWKWISKKVKLVWFKLVYSQKPYTDTEAKQLAQGVLPGHIEQVISFRNINKRTYLAVIKRSSLDDFDFKLILLEEIGETFKPIWETKLFTIPRTFEITDIDDDGMHEILFMLESAGTGAGTKILNIYSLKDKKLYELSEHYEWQDATTPKVSKIEITEEMDPIFKKTFEGIAVKKGFLEKNSVDLNNSENAVLNWHRMNGEKEEGKIRLYFYNGYPKYTSSINDRLETDKIEWIAHFKGPLFVRLKETNEHFIAYSPANIYNWPTSLVNISDILIFGTHSRKGLYAFRWDQKENGELSRIEKIGWRTIPQVWELNLEKDQIIINESLSIPTNEVMKKTHSKLRN